MSSMPISKVMYEFWLKEKLLLTIGLFQFGLILIVFTIMNFSKLIWRKLVLDKRNISEQDNLNKIKSAKSAAIAPSSAKEVANQVKDAMNNLVNHEKNLTQTMPDLNIEPLINQPEVMSAIAMSAIEPEGLEVDLTYKVDIAPDLLTELKEISNDPAAMIDEAIRWWLRRRTFDILDSSSDRQDRVGLKSNSSKRLSHSLWND
jgi:hypothetical protein